MVERTTASDHVPARGARAAALRLAPEFGARLPADVEVSLHTPAGEPGAQYVDPIALAALIVSASQLAWQIYADIRSRNAKPSPEVVARSVRVQLVDTTEIEPADRDRVIDVVVNETLPLADEEQDEQ